ncbi:MAG: hypothetical protein R3Y36_03670 [Spirochaetales bacterium]
MGLKLFLLCFLAFFCVSAVAQPLNMYIITEQELVTLETALQTLQQQLMTSRTHTTTALEQLKILEQSLNSSKENLQILQSQKITLTQSLQQLESDHIALIKANNDTINAWQNLQTSTQKTEKALIVSICVNVLFVVLAILGVILKINNII